VLSLSTGEQKADAQSGNCATPLSGFIFSVNNTLVPNLRNVPPGATVYAHFLIASGCPTTQITLVTNASTNGPFNYDTAIIQNDVDYKSGLFDPGVVGQMGPIQVPNCSFGVALVRGSVLHRLAPDGSNSYGKQGKLIDSGTGGSTNCPPPPPPNQCLAGQSFIPDQLNVGFKPGQSPAETSDPAKLRAFQNVAVQAGTVSVGQPLILPSGNIYPLNLVAGSDLFPPSRC